MVIRDTWTKAHIKIIPYVAEDISMLTDCCDTTTCDQIGIILLEHKTHVLKVPSTSHVYTKYGNRQDLAKGLRLAFQQLQQQCASDIVSKSAQLDPLSGNPMGYPPNNQGDDEHGWDRSMGVSIGPYYYDPTLDPGIPYDNRSESNGESWNAAPSVHQYPPSISSQGGGYRMPPLPACSLSHGQVPQQYATHAQQPGYPIPSQNGAIQQQMPALPGMQFVQGAQPAPYLPHHPLVALNQYDLALQSFNDASPYGRHSPSIQQQNSGFQSPASQPSFKFSQVPREYVPPQRQQLDDPISPCNAMPSQQTTPSHGFQFEHPQMAGAGFDNNLDVRIPPDISGDTSQQSCSDFVSTQEQPPALGGGLTPAGFHPDWRTSFQDHIRGPSPVLTGPEGQFRPATTEIQQQQLSLSSFYNAAGSEVGWNPQNAQPVEIQYNAQQQPLVSPYVGHTPSLRPIGRQEQQQNSWATPLVNSPVVMDGLNGGPPHQIEFVYDNCSQQATSQQFVPTPPLDCTTDLSFVSAPGGKQAYEPTNLVSQAAVSNEIRRSLPVGHCTATNNSSASYYPLNALASSHQISFANVGRTHVPYVQWLPPSTQADGRTFNRFGESETQGPASSDVDWTGYQ
ncbi:hypothetical protein QFC24_000676 [Naganishia onofrii]|uniref:Uncharacterized protein n=1 Tax=Naganishia onofrii TaxID=1851511 RepID=A0ACC2XWT2_9TREE|nr:hypothetical protein QFC24_000676 [Naganishia onofrii]